MEALKENQYILNYWHKIVSIKENSIILSESDSHFNYSTIDKSDVVNGWYAKYHEGVFIYFRDTLGNYIIGWQGKVININTIHSMKWKENYYGRLLECFNKEGQLILKVSYNTLRQYIFKPLEFLLEIVMGDDDWRLVADLPNFIQSCFKNKNIEELYHELKIDGID